MKIKSIIPILALSVSSSSAALIFHGGGSFVASNGNTITYTVTNGLYPDNITDPGASNPNGIIHAIGAVSFTFSEAVVLTIDNHTITGNSTVNNERNTFTANTGNWTGSTAGSGTVNPNGATVTIDGGGGRVYEDWGSASISGITSLSWSKTGSTGEGFTFSADSVPEPTSAALLGLGGLALSARRKR